MTQTRKEPQIKAYQELRDIGLKYHLSKQELAALLKEVLALLEEGECKL